MQGLLKTLPRLSSCCEVALVSLSPHSTEVRAIARTGESQNLEPDSPFFSPKDLLQGSGFIVHLLRPPGLTITGS